MSATEPVGEQTVSVAVVDDDPRVGATVRRFLAEAGWRVGVYTDPLEFLRAFHQTPVDIVITDLQMPGMDGLAVLKAVHEGHPSTEVILVTGHADKETAIQALKLGAFDFFEKPVDGTELVETVKRTVRYRQALEDRDRMAAQLSFVSKREAERWGIEAFVGKSKAVQKVLWDIRLLQRSAGTAVLVVGESGTGKELVARAVHYGSGRAARPFVPVNCSAVPSELAESAFFGHVRGAFTGATTDKKGCFEMADGGTVFLDEVGDMPLSVQIKLLRVLEDGVVTPLGKTVGRKVDVRVIAATNADLKARIDAGTFRMDLFYRLAGFTLRLPALREREEDVVLLAGHYARILAEEMGCPAPRFTAEAMEALAGYRFPGNVRELRNVIERALIKSGGREIGREHLEFLDVGGGAADRGAARAGAPGRPPGDLPLSLAEMESLAIRRALQAAGGNIAAAARLLGINRTKLYRKMAVAAGAAGSPDASSCV